MTEMEFFLVASAIMIIGAALHSITRKKKTHPATNCIARVLQGKANLLEAQTAAAILGGGIRRYAERCDMPPLFIRACGDLYEDFFPPRRPDPSLPSKTQANALLAAVINRYSESGNRKPADVRDIRAFNLCDGAGFGLATFRRLAEVIPEVTSMAGSLAPPPDAESREMYASLYREAGRLTSLPQELVETALKTRLAAIPLAAPEAGTAACRETPEPGPSV
ncbi:hypothetical protein KL86DPRO_20494 [uncultured delta proteobacterium]|uniref:Uncharacterized protein n=1 Tax=uncultured delta proteobacterium TaxID=34034 RepID=A0A212K1A1_9DELT|nr:hypothetical protein KL86DPRO_20494 [uncultured delta proteobacterium]